MRNPPKIALVIGTFGALPYIHTHLEMARRFYPDVSILVHDDASDEGDIIQNLCREYGATFVTTDVRRGHYRGDLCSYARGLEFAVDKRCDVLIKFSRRFIPTYDWRFEIQRLLTDYPSPTLSSFDTGYGYGFRTEAIGMVVSAWMAKVDGKPSAYDEIIRAANGAYTGLLEAWMHNHARRLHAAFLDGSLPLELLDRDIAVENERIAPQTPNVSSYVLWPIAGSSRKRETPFALWYDNARSWQRYHETAANMGLPYLAGDFAKYRTLSGT